MTERIISHRRVREGVVDSVAGTREHLAREISLNVDLDDEQMSRVVAYVREKLYQLHVAHGGPLPTRGVPLNEAVKFWGTGESDDA